MTEFYRQLHKNPIKAEALRQAQIAMIQGKIHIEGNQLVSSRGNIILPPEIAAELQKQIGNNLAHPFFWAPFTMIGNPW
jgi:CHAT domain-containing protein